MESVLQAKGDFGLQMNYELWYFVTSLLYVVASFHEINRYANKRTNEKTNETINQSMPYHFALHEHCIPP
jgi:hypothetical protein